MLSSDGRGRGEHGYLPDASSGHASNLRTGRPRSILGNRSLSGDGTLATVTGHLIEPHEGAVTKAGDAADRAARRIGVEADHRGSYRNINQRGSAQRLPVLAPEPRRTGAPEEGPVGESGRQRRLDIEDGRFAVDGGGGTRTPGAPPAARRWWSPRPASARSSPATRTRPANGPARAYSLHAVKRKTILSGKSAALLALHVPHRRFT